MIFLHIFIKNSFKAIPKPSKFQSLIFQAQSPCLNSPNLSKSMLLSSITSTIFQITYKTQNLVKCQGTLRIKTQSIKKVDRKIYQTKHLSARQLPLDWRYNQIWIFSFSYFLFFFIIILLVLIYFYFYFVVCSAHSI